MTRLTSPSVGLDGRAVGITVRPLRFKSVNGGDFTPVFEAAPPLLAARVGVYDAQGRFIRTLADGVTAGSHTLSWDGRDASGRRVGAGIFFVRASAGGVTRVQRLVRIE